MMKKKTLATLLTLTMLTTAAVPVFAEEGEGNSSTLLTYTPDPNTYTFVIPPNTTIAANGTGTGNVKVKDVLLDTGKSLTVSIGTSTNNFMLKKDESDTNGVAYTITKQPDATELKTGDSVLTVASGKGGDSVTLTYKANKPVVVGTYTDTLTFTAKVE